MDSDVLFVIGLSDCRVRLAKGTLIVGLRTSLTVETTCLVQRGGVPNLTSSLSKHKNAPFAKPSYKYKTLPLLRSRTSENTSDPLASVSDALLLLYKVGIVVCGVCCWVFVVVFGCSARSFASTAVTNANVPNPRDRHSSPISSYQDSFKAMGDNLDRYDQTFTRVKWT